MVTAPPDFNQTRSSLALDLLLISVKCCTSLSFSLHLKWAPWKSYLKLPVKCLNKKEYVEIVI